MLVSVAKQDATGVAERSGELVPWPALLQTAIFCLDVYELAALLEVSLDVVLDSIEALTLVQTDTLGEVFRNTELARAS